MRRLIRAKRLRRNSRFRKRIKCAEVRRLAEQIDRGILAEFGVGTVVILGPDGNPIERDRVGG